jgi:hypothetical protein
MQHTDRNPTTCSEARTTMTTHLCRRCRYHPASPRMEGYCSWDCYEADEDDDSDDEEDAKAA